MLLKHQLFYFLISRYQCTIHFCLKVKISWTSEGLVFSFLSLFFQQPLELTRKILRDKQNKKNSGQPIPVFPSWVYERPALIGDFLIGTSLSTDTTVPIGMWYAGKTAYAFCVLYLFGSAVQIPSRSGWKQTLAPCTLQVESGVQKTNPTLILLPVFLLRWIPASLLIQGI